MPLPPIVEGLGIYKLPVLNVGTLGGGTVTSAAPREAWFTIDLRSLDTETQSRLEQEVIAIARRTAEQEGVGFRLEQAINIDFSKARPQQERLNHPLVQTAVAVVNHLRRPGTPAVVAQDIGSTDANIAVSMGFPVSPSEPRRPTKCTRLTSPRMLRLSCGGSSPSSRSPSR